MTPRLYRTFSSHYDAATTIKLYKSQVVPILDYACVVWDPHFKKDKEALESIRLFATRMAAKVWNGSADELNERFSVPTLSQR